MALTIHHHPVPGGHDPMTGCARILRLKETDLEPNHAPHLHFLDYDRRSDLK